MMKHIQIFTDGACSGNPGPGGWGAILIYKDIEKELSGSEPHTTNNRMELLAAIEALKALKEPCSVDLFTDSAYLHHAFADGWLDRWQKNHWQTSKKQPVENQDLWMQLLELSKIHNISWYKVKGHSDVSHNNRCDALARNAISRLKQ